MNTPQIWLFCTGSLAVSLGLAAVIYPYAVVDRETLEMARTPQPMETLPDVDVGPDFGLLPVTELMGYYIENPPPAPNKTSKDGASAPRQRHFGGC
jgi:hypothetical protein